MKNLFLASFAVMVILSQVACSDDSPAAQYAAANNCTIAGMNTTSATAASQAAQSQVPCSFQSVSKAVSDAGVASTQVNTGTSTTTVASVSEARLNQAVQTQSTKVQLALAKFMADDPTALKAASVAPAVEITRAPSSIGAPVTVEESAGLGEVSR